MVDSIKIALQGLAFWVSYRQILHHLHLLSEGALVNQFATLLNAKLGYNFKILCEQQFDKSKKLRMDVEIRQKNPDKRVAVIEFKRILAGKTSINSDIKKLLKNADSYVLRFLIVVSEKELPKEYVNENGEAVSKKLILPDGSSANVIRVLKSTKSFRWKKREDKKKDKEIEIPPVANYCCLIEVKPSNSRG